MEELEQLKAIDKAFEYVEKYSDYLFRKAWGKTLIIWGIIAPLGLIFYFYRIPFSSFLQIGVELFILLISSLTVLISVGATLYNFTSASRLLKSKKDPEITSSKESHLHGIAIGFIWFILFLLASLIPDPLSILSSLWAGGFAIIFSYFLLKRFHDTFPELLLVGLILLVSSIPLIAVVMIDIDLARIAAVICFSLSFLIGGYYSIKLADDILSWND